MQKLRTALEWISLPLFAFLVVHMGGHGTFLLLEPGHDHGHGDPHEAGGAHELLETILTAETLMGILLMLVFVWLWHRPFLRNLVPCRHTQCVHKTCPKTAIWPHLVATFAFVFHFFPEAHLRLEMLAHPEELLSLAGIIAFGAHFLVDIIVGGMLSLYWPKRWQQGASFVGIAGVWAIALYSAQSNIELFHSEGVLMLVGAFFLSMFIHWPQHTTTHV